MFGGRIEVPFRFTVSLTKYPWLTKWQNRPIWENMESWAIDALDVLKKHPHNVTEQIFA
jgi:hypothetical protein